MREGNSFRKRCQGPIDPSPMLPCKIHGADQTGPPGNDQVNGTAGGIQAQRQTPRPLADADCDGRIVLEGMKPCHNPILPQTARGEKWGVL